MLGSSVCQWVSTSSHRTTSWSAGHLSTTFADWTHNLALHLVLDKKQKRWASKTTSNRLIVESHMTQQLCCVLLCLFVCPVVLMSSALANTSVGTKEGERRKQRRNERESRPNSIMGLKSTWSLYLGRKPFLFSCFWFWQKLQTFHRLSSVFTVFLKKNISIL